MDKEEIQKNIIGTIIQFDTLGRVWFLKPTNFTGHYRTIFETMRSMKDPINPLSVTQALRDTDIENAAWYVADCMMKVNDWTYLVSLGLLLMESEVREYALSKLSAVNVSKRDLESYTAHMDVLSELMDTGNDVFRTLTGAKRYFEFTKSSASLRVIDEVLKNIDKRIFQMKSAERVRKLKAELIEAEAEYNNLML